MRKRFLAIAIAVSIGHFLYSTVPCFEGDEYKSRRSRLLAEVTDGIVVVDSASSSTYFTYLTGIDSRTAKLILVPEQVAEKTPRPEAWRTTLYLPVWVEGAYLSFGDVHAVQGDGEVNGTALEVPAEVTLQIDVLEQRAADWPRLETETHIMALGSTRPLMDCVRLAQMELLSWLVSDYGFQREEAWQLSGQVSSMRIGNVVDPCYTVAARFPKAFLPPARRLDA